MTNFECSTNDHITWIHVINRRHCYRRPTSDGPKDESALYLWAAMKLTEQCIQNNGPTQGYFEYSISLSLLEFNKTPALVLSSSILVTRNSPTLWIDLLFCVLEKKFANAKHQQKTSKALVQIAQTCATQLWDKFCFAWHDAVQFRDCPGHTVGYPGNDCNELIITLRRSTRFASAA